MLVRKIGIDLGTANSIVFVPGKGMVLKEPSVVAVSLEENRILAVGKKAKEMIGKAPEGIKVYRPLREGVIADYRVTQAMLSYFIRQVLGHFRFLKPDLLIGVPAGITSTEKRAMIEAGFRAGAREVFLVKEPILAALGSGIPINSHFGHMVIDIGGGTTETAVISLGGIVTERSLRVAGDKMDEAIASYVKTKYNLVIGDQTAERVKIEIGTVVPEKKERTTRVKGRDALSGLPRTITLSSQEMPKALEGVLEEIIHSAKQVLRETPPELSADIIERGIVLTGGGSQLRNLEVLITRAIGVPAHVAKDPLLCVAKGTALVLENLEEYKRALLAARDKL